MESILVIMQQLCTVHASLIADIRPTDQEGLWLYPRNPNGEDLARVLDPVLAPMGWLISSIKPNRILIEPAETSPAGWHRGEVHYHVSATVSRAAIMGRGLEPSRGGNTTMNRITPSERVYLARDLPAAFEFVAYQCGDSRSRLSVGKMRIVGEPEKRPTRQQLDIWRVELPSSIIVRRDVLFPGKAGYIEGTIPPTNIRRFRAWQFVERGWKTLRRQGWA